MGDPYGLINRAIERHGTRGKRRKNPNNPVDAERMRALHPDYDDIMVNAATDYRTLSRQDAKFQYKFNVPDAVEATRRFNGHTNSVDAVCWGPDQGCFVSASHDSTLKIWDAQSGECKRTLAGHVGGVFHCEVSPGANQIVSCGAGQTKNVLLWNWPMGSVCRVLQGHQKSVHHATFCPEGERIATADQDGVSVLHDVATGKQVLTTAMHSGVVHCSSFCAVHSSLLMTAGRDGVLHLSDLREKRPPVWFLPSMAANGVSFNSGFSIQRAHDGWPVYAVRFVNETTVFSSGADHKLKRWDLRIDPWTPRCKGGEFLGHTAPIRALGMSPDNRFILSGCEDGSCRIWRTNELKEIRAELRRVKEELRQYGDPPPAVEEQVAWRSHRTKLQSSWEEVRASEQALQKVGHVTALRTLIGHTGQLTGCDWQDSVGQRASILTSSRDQTVRLYDVNLREIA